MEALRADNRTPEAEKNEYRSNPMVNMAPQNAGLFFVPRDIFNRSVQVGQAHRDIGLEGGHRMFRQSPKYILTHENTKLLRRKNT